ncbi:tRNA threonylcarbamoyladenosine biosynthesis protein TsaE [Chlamydiales bacterium SCGC AB-751-O23]|jgi:tRNA threonylcarbamoyladenosine biosynthesis protein TsaE|nr:tRNA threonylcarbamoyladenosine biosynthesis protein TsaE [Chlamydiales bacterium SCGC AB-751-O23]
MTAHSPFEIFSSNEMETKQLAYKLAEACPKGAVIALYGDLGSGKTVFCKAFISAKLLIDESEINSPTFVYLNSYDKENLSLHHFDLYRLKAEGDFADLGFEEYFYQDGICLVEWPDKALSFLPENRMEIELKHLKSGKRSIKVSFKGDFYADF